MNILDKLRCPSLLKRAHRCSKCYCVSLQVAFKSGISAVNSKAKGHCQWWQMHWFLSSRTYLYWQNHSYSWPYWLDCKHLFETPRKYILVLQFYAMWFYASETEHFKQGQTVLPVWSTSTLEPRLELLELTIVSCMLEQVVWWYKLSQMSTNDWLCFPSRRFFQILPRWCVVFKTWGPLLIAALCVIVSGVTFWSVIMNITHSANDQSLDFSNTLMTLETVETMRSWIEK